jgi:beta-carotene 3-hydroxylase
LYPTNEIREEKQKTWCRNQTNANSDDFFLIFLGVLFMECVTWLTHKYLMHGFMYIFTKTISQIWNIFERNDIFFAILLFQYVPFSVGAEAGFNYLFFIGLGITAYGFCYSMMFF